NKQSEDRGLHGPERWVVQQHRQHWRGPQPQPDRCRSERPKLPICWRAGGNERRNNQQHLRYWNSASGQRKHRRRLVGQNLGSISNSFASVAVGSPSVANLQAGGLVGNNSGAILLSVATGNVQAGDGSIAGGLVASNSVSGTITSSQASG